MSLFVWCNFSQAGGCHRWANTAESLQLEAPDVAAWNCTMGVTPQIFSTHIALQLGQYLMQRFQTCCWHGYLLDVADRHVRCTFITCSLSATS